jgi:hypothetical protein
MLDYFIFNSNICAIDQFQILEPPLIFPFLNSSLFFGCTSFVVRRWEGRKICRIVRWTERQRSYYEVRMALFQHSIRIGWRKHWKSLTKPNWVRTIELVLWEYEWRRRCCCSTVCLCQLDPENCAWKVTGHILNSKNSNNT